MNIACDIQRPVTCLAVSGAMIAETCTFQNSER